MQKRLSFTAPDSVTDRRRWFEITGVAATGVGKFIIMDWLGYKFVFIACAMGLWLLYVLITSLRNRELLRYRGFRRDTIWPALRYVLPFATITVLFCIVTGSILSTIHLNWHILPLLVLYPLWGIVQQLLMISMVAGNLRDLRHVTVPQPVIVAVTSALFAIVHYPSLTLIGGTFILALFYSIVFLRTRNLWVPGIFHGWLAALFYYTIEQRDPFIEVFGFLSSL